MAVRVSCSTRRVDESAGVPRTPHTERHPSCHDMFGILFIPRVLAPGDFRFGLLSMCLTPNIRESTVLCTTK